MLLLLVHAPQDTAQRLRKNLRSTPPQFPALPLGSRQCAIRFSLDEYHVRRAILRRVLRRSSPTAPRTRRAAPRRPHLAPQSSNPSSPGGARHRGPGNWRARLDTGGGRGAEARAAGAPHVATATTRPRFRPAQVRSCRNPCRLAKKMGPGPAWVRRIAT